MNEAQSKLEFSDTLGEEVVGIIETTVKNLKEIDTTYERHDYGDLPLIREKMETILGAYALQVFQNNGEMRAKPAELFKGNSSKCKRLVGDDFYELAGHIQAIETKRLKWTALRSAYLSTQEQDLTKMLEGTTISVTCLTGKGFDYGSEHGKDSSNMFGRSTQELVAPFYGLHLTAGEILIGQQNSFRIVPVINQWTFERESTLAIAS